jgi:hypothetical protein
VPCDTGVTTTAAIAVALPPGPVAVKVYVVLAGGVTVVLPLAHATAPTPRSIAQLVAFETPFHDRLRDWPARIVPALAANPAIVGCGDCAARTVTLHVAVVPRDTVTVYVPAAAYVVEKVSLSGPVAGVPFGADHEKLLYPLMAVKLAFAPTATVCVLGLQLTCDGDVTVNVMGALVPAGVVTVTFRAPSAAFPSTTKLALRDVPLVTTTPVTVMPEPLTATVVLSATKLVPVRISATLVPVAPSICLRLPTEGDEDAPVTTANDWAALVPPAVVTVTDRAPAAAAASTTKFAVSDVALCTVVAATVTPAPLIATVVALVTKPVPLNVTDTVDPGTPVAGRIAVSVGAVVGEEGPLGVELLPVQAAVRNIEMPAIAQAIQAFRRIVWTHVVIQLRP